jgi:hypothetical protein
VAKRLQRRRLQEEQGASSAAQEDGRHDSISPRLVDRSISGEDASRRFTVKSRMKVTSEVSSVIRSLTSGIFISRRDVHTHL